MRTQTLMEKAELCITLSRAMLGFKVSEWIVEDQAVDLMRLSLRTLKRLVGRLGKQRRRPYVSQKTAARRVSKTVWERLQDA